MWIVWAVRVLAVLSLAAAVFLFAEAIFNGPAAPGVGSGIGSLIGAAISLAALAEGLSLLRQIRDALRPISALAASARARTPTL